jgi:hypothetical protein
LEADAFVGTLPPGVVTLGSHFGELGEKLGPCLRGELDAIVELAFGQSVLHAYPRGTEISLHELLVLVLLFETHNTSAGQAEEIEDELLSIDIATVTLLAHVFVDGRPVFPVLGY